MIVFPTRSGVCVYRILKKKLKEFTHALKRIQLILTRNFYFPFCFSFFVFGV